MTQRHLPDASAEALRMQRSPHGRGANAVTRCSPRSRPQGSRIAWARTFLGKTIKALTFDGF